MSYFLFFFFFFLAILASFLCSVLEAVLLSVTPSYVETLVQNGHKSGPMLKKLKQEVDKPLAAILSLNTVAHTIGSAGVGWQAGVVFGPKYVGIIIGVHTILILILSEIIPKSLGANYWRTLAPITAVVLKYLDIVMYPLVVLSQGITSILSSDKKTSSVSRAEISAMADIGHKEGIFEEDESRVIKNLLRFKSVKAEEVMTPRTVLMTAPEGLKVKELYQNKDYLRFTRIPIYNGKIDNVTGFVHKHDVLDQVANDEHDTTLKEIRRDIIQVPEKMPIHKIFNYLLKKREHIALAVDEYGGVSGIVTMEDVLETLLGIEILDEFDQTKDMQALAKQKWASKAKRLDIDTDLDN